VNDDRLIERLADTDAYSADTPLPDEMWTAAAALSEIERKAGRRPQSAGVPTVRSIRSRRWLLPAAAAFAVIVGAFAIVTVLIRNNGPDVTNDAPLTPLEVGLALNEAIVTGDPEAARQLYADDATYTLVDDGFGLMSSVRHRLAQIDSFRPDRPLDRPLARPKGNLTSSMGTPFNVHDWLADDSFNGFDDLAADAMALYAQGVTTALSCAESAPGTVVCENVLEGHAFLSAPPETTDTFTVVDGLIVHQEYNTLNAPDENTFALQLDYENYVISVRPDQAEGLFYQAGRMQLTPETVEIHRTLIAEWRAQR